VTKVVLVDMQLRAEHKQNASQEVNQTELYKTPSQSGSRDSHRWTRGEEGEEGHAKRVG